MNRLAGKVAVVTGSAHGIGEAIARQFAAEGAWVLVTDIDDDAGLQTVEEMRDAGGQAEFCHLDVSIESEVQHAVELASAQNGSIDVLCNNAAYIGAFHDVLGASDEEWNSCVAVALLGTNRMTRAVLPGMRRHKRGSIVNIVSIQATAGCPTSVAYTATKAALLGFTLSAAYDYGADNIRVNAISPGPIQTRISPKPGEPMYDWQCSKTMLGRVGYPVEIAHAAVFLASDESEFITGINLPVDGGWTAK